MLNFTANKILQQEKQEVIAFKVSMGLISNKFSKEPQTTYCNSANLKVCLKVLYLLNFGLFGPL